MTRADRTKRDKLKRIELVDELFQGHISLERGDSWVRPWRLPLDSLPLYYSDALRSSAMMPAGVRLRFTSDTSRVKVLLAPADAPTDLDCVVDNQLAASATVEPGEQACLFEGLPTHTKWIDVYLPPKMPVKLVGLEIDDEATYALPPDERTRWVVYGSSNVQCGRAASPAQTWPAIVARTHDLNFTCLGYGGQCHWEPMMARLIRDLPADLILLYVGSNIYGAASLNLRTFAPAVIGFVQIIREKRPAVPICVLSPLLSPPREGVPNAVGLTFAAMREEAKGAVDRLRAAGDESLVYADGADVFTMEEAVRHMEDGVHPDADGYRLMAERIDQAIVRPLLRMA